MRPVPAYSAIVLAGGESRRMHGRHKPAVPVGGRPMLERVLAALTDATPRIVVGPSQSVPTGVLITREEPPGGGPVAAIAAGVRQFGGTFAEFVAVVAADQPFLTTSAVTALRRAVADRTTEYEGAAFVDGDRPQLLCGLWRTAALRRRLARLDDPRDVAVRRLFADVRFVPVQAGGSAPPPWYDCDTDDDLATAERWWEHAGGTGRRAPGTP